MHTFDGGDPSHMRQSSVTATEAVMWVEEETCTDAELAHTTETIGVLAMDTGAAVAGAVALVTEFNRQAARREANDRSYYGWKFGFTRHGKIVKEICTRIDGCRIIDNVCVDSLTQKNQWGLLTGDDATDLSKSISV